MGYLSKDEQLLHKIYANIKKVRMLYDTIKPLSDEEIDDGIYGNALAQCITNLYELTMRLDDDEVIKNLSLLISPRIVRFRNISAHDYDAIDWGIGKRTCAQIINTISDELYEQCLRLVENNKRQAKDYTQQ